MDKEVCLVLKEFMTSEQIELLEKKLMEANCIIYKSKLPKLTEQPIMVIDAAPTDDYPLRILQVYRQHCDCQWADNTNGSESTNPLINTMNEHNNKRARILDKAIVKLSND